MAKYILAHDFGTSADKASLFTTEGEFVKTKSYGYTTNYSNGNWAEQDPNDWWKAFCSVTKELIEGIDAKDILCVSFDGTYPNCLCLDENGEPLGPAMIWQDSRTFEECNELSEIIPKKYMTTYPNQRMRMDRTLPKLMWVRKHRPEIYEKTRLVLPSAHNYITYKLTGVPNCDYVTGKGMAMLNVERTDWSDEILGLVDVPRSMLPELHDRSDIIGEIDEEGSKACGLAVGTKVICGTGDSDCSALGAGMVEYGDVIFSGGTSAGFMIKPFPDKPCSNGFTASSGSSFSWLKNNICLYEQELAEKTDRDVYDIINETIETAPIGSNGVMFHPYLAGERAPRNNQKAKGSFVGISLTTTRADIMRSVIEGIGLNISLILDTVRAAGYDPKSVVIAGGLGKGAITRQIFADIMNIELQVMKNMDETATIGCAVIGGIGLGIYEDERACRKFIEIVSTTKPIPENVEKYQKLKPLFEKIYHGLEPVYPDMY